MRSFGHSSVEFQPIKQITTIEKLTVGIFIRMHTFFCATHTEPTMTEETKDFQSKSIFGQRFDPKVPEPLTEANGRSILYKVKLKSDCDQPGAVIAPID